MTGEEAEAVICSLRLVFAPSSLVHNALNPGGLGAGPQFKWKNANIKKCQNKVVKEYMLKIFRKLSFQLCGI